MNTTILIVDDEPVQRRLLENHVNKAGYRAVLAEDGEQAISLLRGREGAKFGAVVLDLVMSGLDGMGTLGKMRELGLKQPVVVQTAQGGIDTVISAMRAGAVDFCVKPVSFERLKVSLQNALKLEAMEGAVHRANRSNSGVLTFDDMIAGSPAMERTLNLGRRAAASNIPVLIEGESGVGKEIVAQAIQGTGARKGKPFITVNCGALPEQLAESILFGHEKGAFTGATSHHVGKFKEADGGTLFLDEVGELTPDLQVKLLRALQEGEIDPVGANRPVKTDFRLISATNRDMIELVKSGQFREDLYYRLNVFPIHIPPLRKRREDIAELVRHFTARFCLEERRRSINGIHRDALKLLTEYDWPGNIRQLENTVFRAVVLCDGDELTLDEFPQIAGSGGSQHPEGKSEIVSETAAEDTAVASSDPVRGSTLRLVDSAGTLLTMTQIEAEAVAHAIWHHDGRMTQVARSLGIGRSTLYRKLREYGFDEADPAVN